MLYTLLSLLTFLCCFSLSRLNHTILDCCEEGEKCFLFFFFFFAKKSFLGAPATFREQSGWPDEIVKNRPKCSPNHFCQNECVIFKQLVFCYQLLL
jgi:hypothetical protein